MSDLPPKNKNWLHKNYPNLDNVKVDPRCLGLQAGLMNYITETSSPRADMYANHINQAMVLDGGEFPFQFVGNEQNLGEYEFSKSTRNQPVRVVKIIPKYPSVTIGHMQIRNNPSITVIYIGLEDNKLGYFTIDTYTKGSDGFGYMNNLENQHLLDVGIIPKDKRLVTSPIHRDGLYCLGTNVNVAFMTLEETIEDAMLISQSTANKLQTTEIRDVHIIVDEDHYPLNLYGCEDEVKFMPDIGEFVNHRGIIAAFRNANAETYLSDIMPVALNTLNLHDTPYYVTAPAGAQIIDITVNASRTAKIPKSLYSQADKYINASNTYWREIISVYNLYRQSEYKLTKGFIRLVADAIQRLVAAGIPVPIPGVAKKAKTKLIAKNSRPIEFMEIKITYMLKRKCQPGFKITGRNGMKGTISRILPDEYMPIDDHGFRAGLVIDPNSSVARMTMGPLYEPAINRTSEFVRRRLEQLQPVNPQLAREVLLEYCNDINPNYADTIRETRPTKQTLDDLVKQFVYEKRILLWIPCGLDTIGLPLIKKLKEKWEIPISPVTYTQCDTDGDIIGTFRTKRNVCIGSTYIYLLSKIPEPSSSGISHISQYNVPMKPRPSDKHKYPMRRGPVRFIGEDEGRIGVMDLKDPRELTRIMGLQATSRRGVDMVCEALLTAEHPTRISRIPISNRELTRTNTIIQVLNHMFATMGVGITKKGPRPIHDDDEESV